MCGSCGGRNTTKPVTGGAKAARAAIAATGMDSKAVQMVYRGPRKGDFSLVSAVTRTRYRVPGQGELVEQAESGRKGVNPADVAWFKSVRQGQDFQVLEPPKPAPPIAEVAPVAAANPDSEAWTPATMESVPMPKSAETEVKSERKPRRKSG